MADRKNKLKVRYSDIPREVLEAVAMVFNYGALKYSQDNWRTAPFFERKVFSDCIDRHTTELSKGCVLDVESGCYHSAHKACNALMELYYDIHGLFGGNLFDNELVKRGWEEVMAEMAEKKENE